MLNVAITGKPAKYWREKLGCKQNELRNYWNDRHLNKIQHLEMYAEKSVTKKGVEPKQAMQDAINFYEFDIASESDFLRKDN